MSADDYVENFLPFIEEFYDLSEYLSKIPLPWYYKPGLDTYKLRKDKALVLYQ